VDGTHTHTLLEAYITSGLPQGAFIGQTLKDHDGEFTVDAERDERVRFATDYISTCVGTVVSERRVHPDTLVGRSDMSGTVDIQVVTTDTLEIIDYKDGMAPVEAKGNHQLEQYALGAVAEMQAAGKLAPVYITMTIIQPKLRMKGLSGISSHKITLGELMIAKDKMIAEAAATDAPDAPLVPGESQCKYCAHKGACPALAGKAMAASGIVFQNLDTGIAQQSANKDPSQMTDKQIVEIMEAAPLLRQMIEGVEAEAQRRLESGVVIEGLKMVNGRGSRSWNVSEDEIAAKLKKMGVPKDHIYESKLVSVAKAEKLSWKKGEETVKLSDRQLKQISEFVSTIVGKPTVALASDARKAVTINAAAMFQAVDHSESIPSWLS
jgi:hypothetical protein